MDEEPPGLACTRRMYELREEGRTMPDIAVRLRREGHRLPGEKPGDEQGGETAAP
ncbi:hypothetical protein [Streptomyces sp. ODS28]|uniref:hypothetical protein n=1 Tax=Streptomyces sp. ODS28 TaxID=3136688 RepID=UPI0031F11DEE